MFRSVSWPEKNPLSARPDLLPVRFDGAHPTTNPMEFPTGTSVRGFWPILKESILKWKDHRASQMAAALAFYSMVSLTPLLVIVIAIVGLVFGNSAAEGRIVEEISSLVGVTGARAIQEIVAKASVPTSSIIVTAIGLSTLLFGATRVFDQLQEALDRIWSAGRGTRGGLIYLVKRRFFSFLMVLGTGFMLLVSLVLSAGLAAATKYLVNQIPQIDEAWMLINQAFGLVMAAILFGLIFRLVPRAQVTWKEAVVGGVLTSVLFSAGRWLIGLYLGRGAFSSVYGVAGSLIVVLLWIYYSAQILLFGAEFAAAFGRSRSNLPDTGRRSY